MKMSNIEKNLSIAQMIDIIQKRDTIMPPEIFKYRMINDKYPLDENLHVDALKNDKLYLSPPYRFNDPYDSVFTVDMERFKKQTVDGIEKQVKKAAADLLVTQAGFNPNQVSNKEIMHDGIPVDKDMLTDLFDKYREVFYDEYFKSQIKFRVCCFSQTPSSILMWSYYCDSHKGFCIGYDTSEIEEKIRKEMYPVFYHDDLFPLVKTEDGLDDGKFNALIKYSDWESEKEWRLILNEEFVELKPSKIYLGVKFRDEYLDYFKDIAAEKNCRLYKMHMDYSRYKLKESEIELS